MAVRRANHYTKEVVIIIIIIFFIIIILLLLLNIIIIIIIILLKNDYYTVTKSTHHCHPQMNEGRFWEILKDKWYLTDKCALIFLTCYSGEL